MSDTDKSRSTFFASVSSELRTPLTLILAPLESLLMGEHGALNAEQEGVLNTVHSNAVRLLQMISGLLDYSNAESGNIKVNRQPIDVRVLAESVFSEFQAVAAMRALSLQLETDAELPETMLIDRYLFERILFNLLANALKFTQSGGTIKVALFYEEERLRLAVSDTGSGIAEDELQGLFLDFNQQAMASMRRYEGIGLGLALVKEFAALLGGTVSVVSELGQGSTFSVDILAPPAPELIIDLGTAGGASRSTESNSGTSEFEPSRLLEHLERVVPAYKERPLRSKNLPRVLIAEGNLELADYIEELLADLCNTRVTATGEEALGLIYEWHPDLILASVTMPRLDGLTLCRAIKSQPETSFIPVVLLTSLTQREVMLQGWEAGADEYLFKPFHPAELVTRVRSLLRSVQQRKRAQEQIERLNEALEKRVIELASANRELKSLATMLEQARDQALEASKFKSVFLANMSHEIRTPINGVISMSDMLMRTRLNSEQVEIANIIKDSAATLLDIINDILDFSKIEAGKLDLEIVDFDLLSVVEGTAELVAEPARQKKLSLMTHVDQRLPDIVRGDPARLRQILLNLLGNAIKFTDRGEVIVRAGLEERDHGRCRVRFSVSDTGIGMAPEAVKRLFKPFTQADGSITRKYGGTGLGLSIAKLLVELLGGQIGVESSADAGSTFWFTIPMEIAQPQTVAPAVRGDLSQYKVLVVDSLPETAKVVKDYLSSWGLRSMSVGSGGEAISLLKQAKELADPFQIVMVELRMPDMDGFLFAQAVKSDPALKDTVLMLCTSEDPEYLDERALDRGFSACLIKPLKSSRLYDCLMLVLNLEKVSQEDEAVYRAARISTTGETALFQNTGMILVAEDNPVNQKVALLLLKELGFSAHVVGSGREAFEAIQRAPYSLALMDCQMPDMDGFEATSAIRRAETLTGRHIPIIAMTAHAMQGDREKCIAAGMDDYISKPVTAAKLKEVLLRWFKTEQSSAWRLARAPEEPPRSRRFENQQPANREAMAASAPQYNSGTTAGLRMESEREKTSENEPVLNFEAIRATCGDEGACELLGIFLSSTSTLLERIDQSILNKDGQALKSSAHELKGACASVGSKEMAEVGKTLEQSALSEDWGAARSLSDRLKSAFAKVERYCQAILESNSAPH